MAMSRPMMSGELNRVLDGYGLSRKFTEYRRLVMSYFSVSLIDIKDESFVSCVVVGSKRDALCSYSDTESDFDLLCILPALAINSDDIKASKPLFSTKSDFGYTEFLLENGPFPGYKYLKLIGIVDNVVLCTQTFSGCEYLRNYHSLFSTTDSKLQFEIHGPALNRVYTLQLSNNKTFSVNKDLVPVIYCRFLPADYDEWCNRNRNHNWPPPWIIEATKKQGCLLVGVGHPASDTPAIEWRLSLSKTEFLLTKSFNHVQMKCYVMMKLVLKRIIQPQMKDPLSSYHVKTVMFWMSEEREEQFWRPDNLAECLISSFKKLKDYVDNKNCPNYFLTDVNLLDGKLDEDIHQKVIEILDSIITEGPMVVYRCLPLNPCFNEIRCEHPTHTSSDCLYQHLLKDRLKEINSINPEYAQSLRSIVETDDKYYHCQFGLVDWYLVNELRNRSGIFSHAFSVLSVLKEIEIPNEKELYSLQKRLITILLKNEHIARIKLATYFYYRRCLDSCIPLLLQVIKSMESSGEFEVCTPCR
ncbi:cyclic GMP-AMP synthase-like receptor 2 [Argopecten irradians]|uniref:cyclic GMP-AMP synthase-like receptor 2 n=1 Tax=Argopecten irradians TaxID=31199 RepID=UPI0037128F72